MGKYLDGFFDDDPLPSRSKSEKAARLAAKNKKDELVNSIITGEGIGANFAGADLSYTTLSGANLQKANFYGSDLTSTNLVGANLYGASFASAYLSDAQFYKANLRKADFLAANLQNAQFSDAELSDANFADAYLVGVDFAKADLTGANFRGVDLSQAKGLTAEMLKTTITDKKTILPAYLTNPEAEQVKATESAIPSGNGGGKPLSIIDIALYKERANQRLL